MALSLHHEDGFEETLERLLEYAVKEVGCSYAGVILLHAKEQIETVAATDPMVADLDKIQLTCGQGPDLDLIGDTRSVVVRDTETEERWPDWAGAVAASGVRSMMGTRLYTTDQTIGSLNFYDVEVARFGAHDLEIAEVLARHAAVAVDTARNTDNLWRAIDSRHLIGMAQGILMERFTMDPDEAFSVLRRYSQDGNVKLHDVAQRVVDSRRLPDGA
jgi:GAF domain-containing protein